MKRRMSFDDIDPVLLLGRNDANLRMIQDSFHATVTARDNEVTVSGEDAEVRDIERILNELADLIRRGKSVWGEDVAYAIRMVRSNRGDELSRFYASGARLEGLKKPVEAKTAGQEKYVEAMRTHDIVVSIGPAGTGKTYLAVAMAVAALRAKEVERIILVRPAVEAGESLGYLPGDFQEKIAPYLRPLYDALREMMDPERVKRLTEVGTIEVIPLAYMRGRTLNDAFVILDEAQNSTMPQMKMFLTRLGFNSRAVITGDITQIDLANQDMSGLVRIQSILAGIEGIAFVYLTDADVVRHRLVREIIKAFERYAEAKEARAQQEEG
ncbi:MAG: PhoH family protein [Candidatus Eisenbacteria bacterium]|nr:PhoH family protein [Candidatus Eisenbacteria bacterium]